MSRIFTLLAVTAFMTSCDWHEECEYYGWLRVTNNWQGYEKIPSSPDRNYALFYSELKGFQGEFDIVGNLEGVPDTVTAKVPIGATNVITYTRPNEEEESSTMSKNIRFKNLESYNGAVAYLDYYMDEEGGHLAEPGLFYVGQSSANVKFEDTEIVASGETVNRIPVLQRQITKFLEFRFRTGKDNPSLPSVTGIRTTLSGVASELYLSTGMGVPESAVTCSYVAAPIEYVDPENPSTDNLANIQFKYAFSVLDFLGRYESVDNTKNILTVYATLENGEERKRSIDITPYLEDFDQLCMVARIDVDVSSDNLKLGVVFAEFEEGLWEYYNIGKK